MLDDSFQVYANFECVSQRGSCPNKAKKFIISFLKLPSLSLFLSLSLSLLKFIQLTPSNVQGWQKSEPKQEILLITWVESINICMYITLVGAGVQFDSSQAPQIAYYYYYNNIF